MTGPRAIQTSTKTQRNLGASESSSTPNECPKRRPLSIPMVGEERTGLGKVPKIDGRQIKRITEGRRTEREREREREREKERGSFHSQSAQPLIDSRSNQNYIHLMFMHIIA